MISAAGFCAELDRRQIHFVTGVPCSFFQGPISLLSRRPADRYVAAVNEGVALALAAGAELAGRRGAVLLQNSGFGNLVNPLTSLAMPFQIPLLVFMSLRGWPDPAADEPQHAIMGAAGIGLLDVLGVPHRVLGASADGLAEALDEADQARRRGSSFFVLVPKGTVGAGTRPAAGAASFRRREAMLALAPELAGAVVYATTGYISRELAAVSDRPENFYMQGSMGHALGLGLGSALARPDRRVIVVDGDGAALMHLGGMVDVGATAPANLTHVVLDNGSYESTGGQRTQSSAVHWPTLAAAVGYRSSAVLDRAGGLAEAVRTARRRTGPHLVVARIAPDPDQVPPRVTSLASPVELTARFAAAVAGPAARAGNDGD